jgi:glycosyltransferase involved in cell wall biosynthesis
MHKVSLIVSTLGERPEDLAALLRSLVPQSHFVSEVIVVDQNRDAGRVPAMLKRFHCNFPIRYTRSERGLSRARNLGLPLATGSLVAFPDDDCVYPDGLLEWVSNFFDTRHRYDILAVGVNDANGVRSGNRWVQDRCDIHPINALRTTFSSSLFLRSGVALTGKFDVRLGVGSGTPYGSGEETDYVLRLIRDGARARFDRTRHVIHPRRDMFSGNSSVVRARSYGFGTGHILRLHMLGVLWAGLLAYDLARAGLALTRGDREAARLCLAQTRGLWLGFFGPMNATTDRRARAKGLNTASMRP